MHLYKFILVVVKLLLALPEVTFDEKWNSIVHDWQARNGMKEKCKYSSFVFPKTLKIILCEGMMTNIKCKNRIKNFHNQLPVCFWSQHVNISSEPSKFELNKHEEKNVKEEDTYSKLKCQPKF